MGVTILGIDPGSRITGFGIIHYNANQLQYLGSGCLRLNHSSSAQNLATIYQHLATIITEYQPDLVSIEEIFFANNARSALKLGQARGVAMATAALHQLPLAEYSARLIKQAVVGYGAASKTQVQQMICQLLKLNTTPQADAADALAVAVCHAHMQSGLGQFNLKTQRKRKRDSWRQIKL